MDNQVKVSYMRKCPSCGKEIYPTPDWVYKRNNKVYCSWKCFNKCKKDKPKHTVTLPKVGDTIRIKYVSGIPHYTNKEGVVEFYDCYGQIHGTWGGIVLIPEEDIFEIIGENDGN